MSKTLLKASIHATLVVTLLALGAAMGFGQNRPAPAKNDLERMQGVWTMVSAESGGSIVGPKNAFFLVDGKRACWQLPDESIEGGIYLDAATEPKSFDFVTSPWTRECIYVLDGDSLRIAYDLKSEAKRPTDFAVPRESQRVVFTLKRVAGPEAFPYRRADGSKTWPPYEQLAALETLRQPKK